MKIAIVKSKRTHSCIGCLIANPATADRTTDLACREAHWSGALRASCTTLGTFSWADV